MNVEKKRKARMSKRPGNVWMEAWDYVKETRNYIYFIIGLFLLSAVVSFLFPENFSFFDDLIKELTSKIEGLSAFELIVFIFQNNVTASFIGMIFGIAFGVFPVFNSLTNGALLGYVFSLAFAKGGYGVIWFLVPHGIFELPAVFISLGLGAKLGTFFFVKKGLRMKEFKRRFWNSLKVFLTIILPLLVVAAVIEGILISL